MCRETQSQMSAMSFIKIIPVFYLYSLSFPVLMQSEAKAQHLYGMRDWWIGRKPTAGFQLGAGPSCGGETLTWYEVWSFDY